MKTIKKIGAQGDVMFLRCKRIPKDATADEQTGPIVVAHSETGHHHSIDPDESPRALLYRSKDPFTYYLRVAAEYADVVHHRPFDTHETVRLEQGDWEVRRQREYTPDGFRRVED